MKIFKHTSKFSLICASEQIDDSNESQSDREKLTG